MDPGRTNKVREKLLIFQLSQQFLRFVLVDILHCHCGTKISKNMKGSHSKNVVEAPFLGRWGLKPHDCILSTQATYNLIPCI